jgi:hypothetical protein
VAALPSGRAGADAESRDRERHRLPAENAPNTWTLVSATDPVPSSANAPRRRTSRDAAGGQERVPAHRRVRVQSAAHKDHTVVIKGLFIKATPTSRINVTSVTTARRRARRPPK